MQDPVRQEVPDAVKTCHNAGILVRMVTGDNVHTARHIAKECGILTEGGVALEGPKFRSMPEDELLKLLPRLQVQSCYKPLNFLAVDRLIIWIPFFATSLLIIKYVGLCLAAQRSSKAVQRFCFDVTQPCCMAMSTNVSDTKLDAGDGILHGGLQGWNVNFECYCLYYTVRA